MSLHIAFRDRGPIELEVDYVVVGSGAGGATAAVTLARAGEKVAIVEAGAWRDPDDYPSSMYGSLRDLFEDWGAQVTIGKAFWPVLQASCVGGTTVVNSAIAVRTPGDVFTRWQREHGVGGGDMAERVWAAQDVIESELCVSEVPAHARGAHNELAEDGFAKIGLHDHAMLRYVKACSGSGRCLSGCRELRKQSLNLNYVPEVLALGGVVLSSAPVQRIDVQSGRATGVSGRFSHPRTRQAGARFRVRARKAVFVAASVTGTPTILRRSGLRSKALGRAFHSHPGVGVLGLYDSRVEMDTGATQGWASLAMRDAPGMKFETLSLPLDLVASRLAGGGTELVRRIADYPHLAHWAIALRAESAGRIRWVLGKPVITYSLDRVDMAKLRIGYATVARAHFAAGAREVVSGVAGLPYAMGPDDLHLFDSMPLEQNRFVAILSHLFGGAIMGRDPATSVCDARGVVHGVHNLFIADASQIPTNLGVNPQHTIMGLARLRAEQALAA